MQLKRWVGNRFSHRICKKGKEQGARCACFAWQRASAAGNPGFPKFGLTREGWLPLSHPLFLTGADWCVCQPLVTPRASYWLTSTLWILRPPLWPLALSILCHEPLANTKNARMHSSGSRPSSAATTCCRLLCFVNTAASLLPVLIAHGEISVK